MLADAEKVNAKMEDEGIDVLIATSLKNVYYTSGVWTTPTVTPGDENYSKTGLYTDYTPPKSMAVWTRGADEPAVVVPPVVTTHIPDEGIDLRDENIFIFGSRSVDPSGELESLSDDVKRVFDLFQTTYSDRREALSAVLDDHVDDRSTIALENQTASAGPTDDISFIHDSIQKDFPHESIIDATRIFQELRLRKTDEEIRRLRNAAEITESVMMDSLELLEEGMTEKEFATECKKMIYDRGGLEQIWTDHNMIGFGPRSAYPHVVPNENATLKRGDLVRFEFGGRFDHYPSDLARTFIFGESDDEQSRRYEVIQKAMDHCRSLLSDHADTDVIMRETIDRVRELGRESDLEGLDDYTGAMIGHNIGLDVHDPPLISPRKSSIEPGMVMNYELMDVQWGIGGIQLEDTVLITEDGIDPFTTAPEELIVVE